jgi:hypothetical protein
MRARYYDSSLGRFINEDPIFDGNNWYAYANNNPLMYHDPTGLLAWLIIPVAIVVVGLIAGGAAYSHHDTNKKAEQGIFTTSDRAAIDFAQNWNGRSIIEDVEYGTYIYSYEMRSPGLFGTGLFSRNRKYYSYTTPHTNNPPSNGQVDFDNNFSPPRGSVHRLAHTHGAWKEDTARFSNDAFSPTDINISGRGGIPIYVATPNGQLLYRDWVWGEKTIKREWSLPHDRNHPNRIDNHNNACSNCC